MSSVQHQFKQRNPKVNLPGYIKNLCMHDKQLTKIFVRAIDYSLKGAKKVASANTKQPKQTDSDKGE
jgi:hypothetical protein